MRLSKEAVPGWKELCSSIEKVCDGACTEKFTAEHTASRDDMLCTGVLVRALAKMVANDDTREVEPAGRANIAHRVVEEECARGIALASNF
mmetsp:Transcript_9150/g.24116  ORF Transcript_9150/g.24116 Transcript_9150/m.24116 type:complete len:91 (+) Transcript_9150:108-380(+)